MRLPWPIREARLARLAARAGKGDRAAVVSIYRALHPDVSRFVGRRVASRAEAEDAVAATFHRLLESMGRLDGARGSVTGYALAVARSVLKDGRRTRREAFRLEDTPEPEDPRADPLGQPLRSEAESLLRRRLADLPEDTRELLALRFADGLRWAEIAAVLGEPEGALRQRSSRALRDLRDRWAEAPEGSLPMSETIAARLRRLARPPVLPGESHRLSLESQLAGLHGSTPKESTMYTVLFRAAVAAGLLAAVGAGASQLPATYQAEVGKRIEIRTRSLPARARSRPP